MQLTHDVRIYQGQFLGNRSVNTFPQQRTTCNSGDTVGNGLCFIWSVSRSYKEDNWSGQVSSVRESVKRELEPGGRGIAIVRAVTRKRLVTDRTLDFVLQ
jgi:hypothetical protein